MLNIGGRNLPGWRDFERAVALVFSGETQESKAIFDVLLTDLATGIKSGISCKMRDTLRETRRTGQATIEVTNSSGYFWTRLRQHGLDERNYHNAPTKVGQDVIHLVREWHENVNILRSGHIDLTRSYYLALQWDHKSGDYQLFQFSLELPDPAALRWEVCGKRLVGWTADDRLFEWYGLSGGQLKYYPNVSSALWRSEVFGLEPLPAAERGYSLIRKAAELFPMLWQKACEQA
jgi:hypothetical protein